MPGELESWKEDRNVGGKCHILISLKWHKIKQFLPPNFSFYIRNLNVLNGSSLVCDDSWASCWSWCTSRAENQWLLLLTVKLRCKKNSLWRSNVDFSGLSLDFFIDLTECGCAELDLRLSPTLLIDCDPVNLPILSIPKLASPNSAS